MAQTGRGLLDCCRAKVRAPFPAGIERAKMLRRRLMLGAAAAAVGPSARANNFPNGPFRIIVPFGA